MPAGGHRVYDWWSRHPLARRLLYAVAFLGRERRLRDRTIAALDLAPGDRVVDFGRGAGEDLARLRAAVGPEGVVVGVDASAGMVDRARDRVDRAGWDNVHVVRGDAARLPLDGPVDAVHAAMSLTAMPDQRGAVRAAKRVLTPDGRAAVLDARPYPRWPFRALNPLVRALFGAATNWQPDNDLVGGLREAFAVASVSAHFGGAIVVVRAERPRTGAIDGSDPRPSPAGSTR